MRTFPFHFVICLTCLGHSGCNREVNVGGSPTEGDSAPPGMKVMDEEQRQLLWQIEHHGNVLNRVGFPTLANALKNTDQTALAGLLASNFTGEMPQSPSEVSIHNGYVEVTRQTDAGKPPAKLDSEQFVAKLLEYRRYFGHSVKGSKIALMKLWPTQRDNLDAPWEGTAQMRLWGEREPGKPAEIVVYLTYRTMRPTQEVMAAGKWLLSCSINQSQIGFAQRFLMREVAAERGLEPARLQDNWLVDKRDPATGGVFLCDYNRDGILDVLVTDTTGYYLYKGLPGGKFKNVTAEVGLPEIIPESSSRARVAAWVDLDGDGWEDLILGPYIFRNLNGQRFQNVTPLCNLHLPASAGGVAVADFDGDGRMDLYVFHTGVGKADSWIDGKAGTETGNQLWHNKGNWKFEDVTASSRTAGGDRSTFTALWFDANNDGKPDLYVPNEFGDGVLYINQGNGTFLSHSLTNGRPNDFGTMGATCGDIDNDGNIDLYCGNMYSKAGSRVIGNVQPGTYPDDVTAKIQSFVKGSELHLNRGGLRFEQKGREWQVADAGWAYGPALVDLDNDGWLDIHATCGYISRSRTEPDG
ncbi:MAG: FG-GAP repeat domain-containing protein [Gemmataceae bacterium]